MNTMRLVCQFSTLPTNFGIEINMYNQFPGIANNYHDLFGLTSSCMMAVLNLTVVHDPFGLRISLPSTEPLLVQAPGRRRASLERKRVSVSHPRAPIHIESGHVTQLGRNL